MDKKSRIFLSFLYFILSSIATGLQNLALLFFAIAFWISEWCEMDGSMNS